MIPVILSGGSGTRLWPVSRASLPKQFALFFNESLLAKTLKRLKPFGSPWVITHHSMKVLTEKCFKDLHIPTEQILLEPEARNTAPAIALLCKVLEQRGLAEEVVGVFPADHLIENETAFGQALKLAERCARDGQIVTLGLHPTFPATGYGYIETASQALLSDSGLTAYKTAGFREKPNLETARTFVKSGKHFWNGGIFVFKVKTMIHALNTLMPELQEALKPLKADLSNLEEAYSKAPGQSIDYGVMEKTEEQACIPCEIGWSDIGSWDELMRLLPASEPALEQDSKNNAVFSKQDKTYAFVGVDDLIVVDTADATLIAKKGSTQKVKEIAEQLKAKGHPRLSEHPFEYRPWGYFEILRDTADFKSKVIRVDPGQQLSYQSHKKRAEHWVLIKGEAEVVLNDEVKRLKPGESIYIPMGAKHRMRNPGKETLEFVEVQVGTYFGEDDIIRYQDDYKRS